jgi:hypothetical protein
LVDENVAVHQRLYLIFIGVCCQNLFELAIQKNTEQAERSFFSGAVHIKSSFKF